MTTLPLEEHGFCLHKVAFIDALALRYGWCSPNTATNCVCGANFTIDHALSCPRGGFLSIRHNEIRDLTATLMIEVCKDVCVEPDIQALSSETMARRTAITSDTARLDIAANGFWGGKLERTFIDVRVFNPHAPSNRSTSLEQCFRNHELEKKRAYEQRVREVEHASFTPLVLSASGGLGKEATVFYKRLASLLAEKWDQPYHQVINWLRCSLSYSLLRSAIQCARGSWSSRGRAIRTIPPMDLVSAGAHLCP